MGKNVRSNQVHVGELELNRPTGIKKGGAIHRLCDYNQCAIFDYIDVSVNKTQTIVLSLTSTVQ